MVRRTFIVIAIGIVIPFNSCRKSDTFPDVPHIEFKELAKSTSVNGLDTAAKLTLFFTDGDGDIGLRSSDTLPPFNPGSEFYYNFFLKYFKKQNGVFQELLLLFPPNQRIPFIANESSNKAISGDIILNLEFAGLPADNDTFRFEAYIVDRALHKSNVITSSELVLKTQ